MLLTVRTKQDELKTKDILDIDFDMSVKENEGKYVVKINKNYWDIEQYLTKGEAEERMMYIAAMRNKVEESLEDW